MRKILIACLAIAPLVVACNPAPKTKDPTQIKIDVGMARREAAEAAALKPKDRGDVEQTIFIEANLAKEAQLPTIESRESKDARPKLNLLELRIHPPYPFELPFDVTARSAVDFTNSPVVVRVKVLLDDIEIGSFSGVVGKSPLTRVFAQEKFDILKGRITHPKSMLLFVKAEALLMPEGTDITTIDPSTATTTPERRTIILGNPVRIEFVEGLGDVPADAAFTPFASPTESDDPLTAPAPDETAPAAPASEPPAPAEPAAVAPQPSTNAPLPAEQPK